VKAHYVGGGGESFFYPLFGFEGPPIQHLKYVYIKRILKTFFINTLFKFKHGAPQNQYSVKKNFPPPPPT